jgi:hypothetical protein
MTTNLFQQAFFDASLENQAPKNEDTAAETDDAWGGSAVGSGDGWGSSAPADDAWGGSAVGSGDGWGSSAPDDDAQGNPDKVTTGTSDW